MTLMIASVREKDLVLTADGRSTTRKDGVVTGVDDAFQKLFPIPDHPLVVAHMGENRLGDEPLNAFFARFFQKLNAGDLTALQVADELRHYAHPAIRTRLQTLGTQANGCNLWVAGFGFEEKRPTIVELFWQWKNGALHTEERRFGATSVIPGGDGKDQIRPVNWRDVDNKTVDEVSKYHQSLMDEAMAAKLPHNSVGGHVHELVITREQWRWLRPPKAR